MDIRKLSKMLKVTLITENGGIR